VWLFVPNLEPSPPSAEASSASSAASDLLCPPFALWLLSSGKPTRLPSSLIEWSKAPWSSRLSGTIWNPSTAARGAASWISSLRDSLASPPASPADGSAPTMIDGCGPTSGASRASSALDGCSSRTCPACSASAPAAPSRKSSGTWRRAGGMRNGTVSRRQPSAPLTRAIVSTCSLPTPLPTPTASEYGSSQNGINGLGGEHERPSANKPSLSTMARDGRIPTPMAADASRGAGSNFRRGNPTLGRLVRDRSETGERLPTPVARDHKGAGMHNQLPTTIAKLAERVQLPTPTARDCKQSGVAGNWTIESGRRPGATLTDVAVRGLDTPTNSPPDSASCELSAPSDGGGTLRLNPRFVEWMMGWPPGWTEVAVPPTSTRPTSRTASTRSATALSTSAQLTLGLSSGTDSER
jgi:hypothetical protein